MSYFRAVVWLDAQLAVWFHKLGKLVGRHPVAVIFASLLVSVALCSGWARFDFEADSEKLYAPTSSRAAEMKAFVFDRYPQSRLSRVIVAALPGSGASVLSSEASLALLELDRRVRTTANGRGFSFDDLCFRVGTRCSVIGIGLLLSPGGNGDSRAGLEAWAAMSREERVGMINTLEASGIDVDDFFGGIQRNAQGHVTDVKVIRLMYELQFVHELDGPARDFEKHFQDICLSQDGIQALPYSDRSTLSGEVERAVTGDIALVGVGFAAMTVFTMLALGQCSLAQSRVLLGIAAVGSVSLSLGAGFGLAMWLGLQYASLVNILGFVLLGIGVDDSFILVQALNDQPRHLTVQVRVARALANAGPTVLTTSLTDAMAFALGTASPIYAIRLFCAYATLAIVVDFALQVTFFVALMTLDERRRVANRVSFCPCIRLAAPTNAPASPRPPHHADDKTPEAEDEWEEAAGVVLPPFTSRTTHRHTDPLDRYMSSSEGDRYEFSESDSTHDSTHFYTAVEASSSLAISGTSSSFSSTSAAPSYSEEAEEAEAAVVIDPTVRRPKPGVLETMMERFYTPVLLHPITRVFVLLLTAALIGYAVYAGTQLEEGLSIRDLAPDDSFMISFFDLRDATMGAAAYGVGTYCRQGEWWRPDIQDRVLALQTDLVANDWVASAGRMWLPGFRAWVASSPFNGTAETEEGFTAAVHAYRAHLESTGLHDDALLASDFAFDDDGRLASFRFFVNGVFVVTVAEEVAAMRNMRWVADQSGLSCGVWHPRQMFAEQFVLVTPSVVQNLLVAGVAVLVVGSLFFRHLTLAVLALLMVGIVDLALLAVMHMGGITISSVSLVNIVMSVGIAFDASAHIARQYSEIPGIASRGERARFALNGIGVSVSFGGFTSLLGVVPLALSKSPIFRTFFVMYFGIVVFALYAGLVVLPVLLSMAGPRGLFCCTPPQSLVDDAEERARYASSHPHLSPRAHTARPSAPSSVP